METTILNLDFFSNLHSAIYYIFFCLQVPPIIILPRNQPHLNHLLKKNVYSTDIQPI